MKELIERYLKNLMNVEEKSAFITRLQHDKALQQEVRMAKMAIMLNTVLQVELPDENQDFVAPPIIINGTKEKKSSSALFLLKVAACILLLEFSSVLIYSSLSEFEQSYYEQCDDDMDEGCKIVTGMILYAKSHDPQHPIAIICSKKSISFPRGKDFLYDLWQ